jgi:hypothetical protein
VSDCTHRYQHAEVLADMSAWIVCAHCGHAEPMKRVTDPASARTGYTTWTGEMLNADEEMTVVLPWAP